MKKYVLPYGQGSKEIELDETLVLKEVRTKEFEPMKNIPYEILEAIYHPIGCPPINEIIKPGQKIAFICNDPTRVANSFDFMPVLVNEMNKLGVKDEDMHIVFALGTHRPMTDEEMVKAVGKDVASRLKMYNSLCNEQEDFKYFGTTSRGTPVWINKHLCDVDHVILTGTIVHHYFSGYGGGRKPFFRAAQPWKRFASTTASCSILQPASARPPATPAMKTRWKVSHSSQKDALSSCLTPS